MIFASFAGGPDNPPWYFNLLANPEVSVEVGTKNQKVRAAVVDEPERSALYKKMIKIMPGFAEYELKTTRKIPVIALTPT